MLSRPDIFHKQLVLVGGGHTHALIARMFGMQPLVGVKIILISDVYLAPYSGMIPGYLAGLYSHEEAHIDLERLCRFAGIDFVHASVERIDPDAKEVFLKNRSRITYDVLSIDIGSTPHVGAVPGAAQFAIPVKPIPKFLASYDSTVARLQDPGTADQQIVIVGGGAAGVEVSLGLRRRIPSRHRVVLVQRGPEVLTEQPRSARMYFKTLLQDAGVEVRTNAPVRRVDETVLHFDHSTLPFDTLYWMTQASPANWLSGSGLDLDEHGFIRVKNTLQTLSHPDVFAAGDIASIEGSPRPKAGVFAVRQAGPLARNIRAKLYGRPFARYKPQKNFLVLIGTGDERAVAIKGQVAVFGWFGPLLWRWKDHIDKKFMHQFSDLSLDSMSPNQSGLDDESDSRQSSLKKQDAMRCQGCASKVGGDVLSSVIAELVETYRQPQTGFVSGLRDGDDAAVFNIPAGQSMVQTIDYLTAIVSDPFLLGQIAVVHSFSDVFAMGAAAHSALALANVPFSRGIVQRSQLFQLLSGVMLGLSEHGITFSGGHSTESKELGIGIAATGTVDPDHLMRKSGMQPGDALILTKALGTGLLFAAGMRLKAKGQWIESAIKSMLISNRGASQIAKKYGVKACTDVTGFGLAGHLNEMLQADLKNGVEVSAVLRADAMPVLPGARACIRSGIESSLLESNVAYTALGSQVKLQGSSHESSELMPLLFDPQTSGGLLLSVNSSIAEKVVAELRSSGCPDAQIIGSVEPFHEARIILQ